jgi:hypothetical protein
MNNFKLKDIIKRIDLEKSINSIQLQTISDFVKFISNLPTKFENENTMVVLNIVSNEIGWKSKIVPFDVYSKKTKINKLLKSKDRAGKIISKLGKQMELIDEKLNVIKTHEVTNGELCVGEEIIPIPVRQFDRMLKVENDQGNIIMKLQNEIKIGKLEQKKETEYYKRQLRLQNIQYESWKEKEEMVMRLIENRGENINLINNSILSDKPPLTAFKAVEIKEERLKKLKSESIIESDHKNLIYNEIVNMIQTESKKYGYKEESISSVISKYYRSLHKIHHLIDEIYACNLFKQVTKLISIQWAKVDYISFLKTIIVKYGYSTIDDGLLMINHEID